MLYCCNVVLLTCIGPWIWSVPRINPKILIPAFYWSQFFIFIFYLCVNHQNRVTDWTRFCKHLKERSEEKKRKTPLSFIVLNYWLLKTQVTQEESQSEMRNILEWKKKSSKNTISQVWKKKGMKRWLWV
jgi:hypothetical protein